MVTAISPDLETPRLDSPRLDSASLESPSLESPSLEPPGDSGMLARVKSFLANQNGATAIEYALIAAGIAAAIITTVQGLGTKVTALFSNVDSALN
jgi:pilus assembly protein Flp/PilA